VGAEAARKALVIAEDLRAKGIWAEMGASVNSLKSQMKRADRMGAAYVLFLGEDELNRGAAGWKNLADGSQGEVGIGEVCDFFQKAGK